MRSEKLTWIYSGLAIPSGVGVVRKKEVRFPLKKHKVLLVGNEHAKTLVTFFSKFALVDNVAFRADMVEGSQPGDWLTLLFADVLRTGQHTVVVMSFGGSECEDMRKLGELIQRYGAKAIAVVHPENDKEGKTRSVRFFATIASKIWSNHVKA